MGIRLLCLVLFVPFAVSCAVFPWELERQRKVSCFETARVSLKAATEAVEKLGGRVVEAGYRLDTDAGCFRSHHGYYEVTVLTEGRLSIAHVDAHSGRVEPRLTESVSSMASNASRPAVSFNAAIAAAERYGGKAIAARSEPKGGKPGYMIELLASGNQTPLWVDEESAVPRLSSVGP